MCSQSLLFDINETVLNLSFIKPLFKKHFGDEALLNTWFSMLLHSSTVCLATGVTTNFRELALANLHSLAGRLGIELSTNNCEEILAALATLPPHEDVKPALTKLRAANFKLVAFSNSSINLLKAQLQHAGLLDYFDLTLSVESANTFKPSPDAYQLAINTLGQPVSEITLIAAHDWDTHGAICAGLNAAYINRLNAPYNPHYKKPQIIANSMHEMTNSLLSMNKKAFVFTH